MRLKIGTRIALDVLDQFCKWSPAQAYELRGLMQGATKHGLELTVAPIRPKRTDPQNALYWKIVDALAGYVGMTKAELHEEVLSELHGYDLVEFRGSIHKRPRGRSHNLKRDEFSPLIEIAQRWAAESGVHWEAGA